VDQFLGGRLFTNHQWDKHNDNLLMTTWDKYVIISSETLTPDKLEEENQGETACCISEYLIHFIGRLCESSY
jgi:hypothetical protein